jgi:Mannosyltransferase (PIG-V)
MHANQANSTQPQPVEKTTLRVVTIWLALRILTSLLAALFSALQPLTSREMTIPLWPPPGELSAWLERVLVAPWLHWDGVWFTRIVAQGYAAGDGTTNFHPLYPWLSLPLARLGLDPTASLLVTSSLATLLLLIVFVRLARLDLGPAEAWTALLCLVTFPTAFVLFAPYSEGLFLLGVALALLLTRRGRPLPAALAAFLAALTHQLGLFLALPMAWQAWEASGRSPRGLVKAWREWLAVLAAPLGLTAWSVYRLGVLHEGRPDFHGLQALVYSTLISPSARLVVPVQAFVWPWQALGAAITKALRAPDTDILVNLALGLGFLLALAVAWRQLKIGDQLFALAVTLISFCYSTGPAHPYMGLPRHLMVALPVLAGLGAALRKPWQRQVVILVQALGMILLLLLYVLEAWVP